jgi:hypothetical protein
MLQAIDQDIGQSACPDIVITTDTARSYVRLRGELDPDHRSRPGTAPRPAAP